MAGMLQYPQAPVEILMFVLREFYHVTCSGPHDYNSVATFSYWLLFNISIIIIGVESTAISTDISESAAECDIGKLLHQRSGSLHGLSREEKYRILVKNPNPDPSVYPRTRPYGSGSFRQFQPSWLAKFPWLHYSVFCDGVFCRACAVFAPDVVGGHTLGQFVTKPFKSWTNMTQKMTSHGKLDYHMTASMRMSEFLATYKHPSQAVNTRLDIQAQKQLEDNQHVLESLFKIVLLLGKQGLAFRGHRDDQVEWQEQIDHENRGNFVEMVKFRAETDEALRKHLQNAPKNAQYTSKTIQNELIHVVGKYIQSEILHEIEVAKYYSVLADELSDVANKEQLSISFRYVYRGAVKEVFVDFVEVERITGKALAEAIIHSLTVWGLSLSHMRGQCFDGASNMAGARSGCSSIIRQVAPLAVYHHCAAHRLNLAVVSACKIAAFKNTESYIGEMARFFQYSAKRQRLLDRAIDMACPEVHTKKLKDSCKTRWIQHIDSYIVFLELLPAVHMALQAMVSPHNFSNLGTNWNWDGDTVMKANGFIHQLECSTFLVTFRILLECLSCLRSLTVKLQMQAIDVIYAYKELDHVLSSLKSMRSGAESRFGAIFKETTQLAKSLHGEDFELKLPRLSSRQAHRDNVPASSAEEYFRISLYNEFVSHLIEELEERFTRLSTPINTIGLLQLLPSQCTTRTSTDPEIPEELSTAAEFYVNDLPHAIMLPTEYRMWVAKWNEPGCEVPVKLVDAFKACDPVAFPNIHALLHLALTIPITTCECERSFSQLKLIKTPHRSTTSASRLSGLSLMKMNREICDKLHKSSSEMKTLMLQFHQMHPRRMNLSFMLAD